VGWEKPKTFAKYLSLRFEFKREKQFDESFLFHEQDFYAETFYEGFCKRR